MAPAFPRAAGACHRTARHCHRVDLDCSRVSRTCLRPSRSCDRTSRTCDRTSRSSDRVSTRVDLAAGNPDRSETDSICRTPAIDRDVPPSHRGARNEKKCAHLLPGLAAQRSLMLPRRSQSFPERYPDVSRRSTTAASTLSGVSRAMTIAPRVLPIVSTAVKGCAGQMSASTWYPVAPSGARLPVCRARRGHACGIASLPPSSCHAASPSLARACSDSTAPDPNATLFNRMRGTYEPSTALASFTHRSHRPGRPSSGCRRRVIRKLDIVPQRSPEHQLGNER